MLRLQNRKATGSKSHRFWFNTHTITSCPPLKLHTHTPNPESLGENHQQTPPIFIRESSLSHTPSNLRPGKSGDGIETGPQDSAQLPTTTTALARAEASLQPAWGPVSRGGPGWVGKAEPRRRLPFSGPPFRFSSSTRLFFFPAKVGGEGEGFQTGGRLPNPSASGPGTAAGEPRRSPSLPAGHRSQAEKAAAAVAAQGKLSAASPSKSARLCLGDAFGGAGLPLATRQGFARAE